MNNCMTCKHNSYLPNIVDWVSCSHPVTLAKEPKWEPGDPSFVSWRTADVRTTELAHFNPCPAYEAVKPNL